MALSSSTESCPGLVAIFLKGFQTRFKHLEGPKEGVAALMAEVLAAAGRDCQASVRRKAVDFDSGEVEVQVEDVGKTDDIAKDGISFLVHMFEHFRDGLFDDTEFSCVSLAICSVRSIILMLGNSK